jgi:hypothetical protein
VTVLLAVKVPQLVVTVAVNWAVPPCGMLTTSGLTVTLTIRSVTTTAATALLEASARLVATTW